MRKLTRRYEKYNDSNIEWIGEIPEHWEVKRVKDIGLVVLGKMLDNTGSDDKFYRYYLKSKNIGWLKVDTTNIEQMYFSLAEMKYCRLKRDDLLLSEGGEVGKTSIWEEEIDECYIQNSVQKITIYNNNSARYFLYQSFLLGNIKYYDSIVNHVSIKHLTKEKLSKVVWVYPPPSEQKTIAHYLDTKTAQIDRKIDLLTQKAQRYEELKKAIVNETVTRGLDKSVPMKDSAIEWIGEIPEHWEVKRHKDNFHLVTKRCEERNLIKVGLENIESQTGRFLETDSEFDGDGIEFEANDILFGKLRPYLAKVYLSEFRGSAVGDIFVYRPGLNLDPNFSRHTMLSHKYIDVINSSTIGAKMPRVSSNFIANLPFATPPLSEQKTIAHYLDTKTAQIDQIIQTINTQIEKLQELRKTLINDVVTGKIKVIDNG